MSEIRVVIRNVANGTERDLVGVVPVGRGVTDGVNLTMDGTSRRHASISVSNGMVSVEDAGSRNGTFVNDQPVTQKTRLNSGDRVRFDKEEFEIRVESSEPTVVGPPADPKKGIAPSWNTSGSDGTERFTPEQLAEYLRKAKERQGKHVPSECKEPCLRVVAGEQQGRLIPLTPAADSQPQEWTIGRGKDCTIRFEEHDISEWHAKIVREDRKWKLIDAISSNGTFVNDLQVGMSYLGSGDTLRFGRVECEFLLPATTRLGGLRRGAWRARHPSVGGSTWTRRKNLILIAITISFLVTLMALFVIWFFDLH